jgi:ElaB/YqjD/DUF883 family membrane-anchored ribosome-binding protein
MACRLELKFNGEAHPRTCDQCSVSGYAGTCPLKYRFIRKEGISHNEYQLVNKDNINNEGQLIGMDGIPCRLVLEPGLKIAGDKKMSIKLSTLENVKFLVDKILVIQKDLDTLSEIQEDLLQDTDLSKEEEIMSIRDQIGKMLNLPDNRLSLNELRAVLPLRQKSLKKRRDKLATELEGYGFTLEADGPLRTTLRDVKDFKSENEGQDGFLKN